MRNILMLPGTQCDERLWGVLKKALGQEFKLQHWAIPQLEIDQVLENLHQQIIESRPDVILGFSLGGYLIARYLKNYELRADLNLTYVIVGNTPTALPAHELKQRRRIIKNLDSSAYQGANKQRVSGLLAPSNSTNSKVIKLIQDMDRDLGPVSLAHQLSFTGERLDCLNALNNLAAKANIHFVTTAKDPLVNYAWLTGLSPFITKHQIIGAGHMVPLEYPFELADILIKLDS